MESATENNRRPVKGLILKRDPNRNEYGDWVKGKGENVR